MTNSAAAGKALQASGVNVFAIINLPPQGIFTSASSNGQPESAGYMM
jgi:hypothetical protein